MKAALFTSDKKNPRRPIRSNRKDRTKRLSLKKTGEFAGELAMLLEGGHTLQEAVYLLGEFRGEETIAAVTRGLSRELNRGESFRKALEICPITIPQLFKALSGIAESTGSLAEAMRHLEHHYDRLERLREKLKGALAYPVMVCVTALAAVIYLTAVTLPNLRASMEVLGFSADRASGISSRSGISFAVPLLLCSAAIPAVMTLLHYRSRSERNGEKLKKMILFIPGIGAFLRDWNLMEWSFALEICAGRGMPLDAALLQAAETVRHSYLRNRLVHAAEGVSRGESLSRLLSDESWIPGMMAGWIRIGERTGRVQSIFSVLRKHFETRIARSVDSAARLIEPILILFVGGGMILIVVRYVLPLFRMLGEIQ